MTKEQLFKAELSDLLKEYGVRICVEEERGHWDSTVRGIQFYKPYENNPQEDIDFTLLGYYFDYKDLEVK